MDKNIIDKAKETEAQELSDEQLDGVSGGLTLPTSRPMIDSNSVRTVGINNTQTNNITQRNRVSRRMGSSN